ncbi:MAG: DinB family protein [Saprospiraceae bacterium]|nr:DinB family protein [Saprospiraceae bacterium]
MKNYRDSGAVGALLDEYERAVEELKILIGTVNSEELKALVDKETPDMDCRSIQTILTHVVRAANCYVLEIRKSLGEEISLPARVYYNSIPEYLNALNDLFQFTEKLFLDYPLLKLEEPDPQQKIVVSWGQSYDVEQLIEHAIVHILRHRRQIERFLIRLRN